MQIHTNGLAAKTDVRTGQIKPAHITPILHFAVAPEIADKPMQLPHFSSVTGRMLEQEPYVVASRIYVAVKPRVPLSHISALCYRIE